MALLRVFLRRKWLFMVPFVLCLGMAYGVIKIMQPVYESAGQLRVIAEGTSAHTIADVRGLLPNLRNLDRETLSQLRTIIYSPKFLAGIIENLDPDDLDILSGRPGKPGGIPEADRPGLRALANRLEHMIRISPGDEHIFTIRVRHTDPGLAYTLANDVINGFMAEEQATRLARSERTRDFLRTRRTVVEQNLAEARESLTRFRTDMLSNSLLGTVINERNISRAEIIMHRRLEQGDPPEAAALDALKSKVRDVLPDPAGALLQAMESKDIKAHLQLLESLEYDLLVSDLDGRTDARTSNPSLGSTRLELYRLLEVWTTANVPQATLRQAGDVVQYLYAGIYRHINTRNYQQLEDQIAAFRNFMTQQPDQAATLTSLQQEVDAAHQLLLSIDQDIRRQEMGIAAGMSEIGYSLELRRTPLQPRVPVEPDKMRLAMMGFVLALGIGLGLVVLAEMMDRSFKTIPQIEGALGVPVFGSLPSIDDTLFLKRGRRRILFWMLIVISIAVLAAVVFLWLYPRLTA